MPAASCSGRLEGRDYARTSDDIDIDIDIDFDIVKDSLTSPDAHLRLRQKASPSATSREPACPETDDNLDSSTEDPCLPLNEDETEDGTGVLPERPRHSGGAWVSKRGGGGGGGAQAGALRIEPSILDFGESPVCIPTSVVVEVRNQGVRRGGKKT